MENRLDVRSVKLGKRWMSRTGFQPEDKARTTRNKIEEMNEKISQFKNLGAILSRS